jgi:hypothetical protein
MMCIAGRCGYPGIMHHEWCEYQKRSDNQDSDDGQHEADVKCTHGSSPFFPG